MARVSKKLQELVSIMDMDFIDENEIEEVEGYAEFIVALKEQAIYITEERELGKVLHNIEENSTAVGVPSDRIIKRDKNM